ncbi:MAG: TylF/MycF/NovP-related O-methyltransferase [Planctomycetaceae bacterium]
MKARKHINAVLGLAGYSLYRSRRGRTYEHDGLITDHNHDFVRDPHFDSAYRRGVQASHVDYQIEWRTHIALWAAFTASKLPGDFVECGVNWGFLSSAIMEYLDWNSLGRHFFLLDTFNGLSEDLLNEEERAAGAAENSRRMVQRGKYNADVETVRRNFSGWQNVKIIQGAVPGTLSQVTTDRVAYLHIDMNCAAPEVAALEFFWPKLVPGAMVLLDDYGFPQHEPQKRAIDACAEKFGVMAASLPTGQGLIIKPAMGL